MKNKKRTSRGGFTLVELMVSLCIFSLMSTAIASMMFVAYDTNHYVRSESNLVTQVETAMRRIMDNTRSASTFGPFFTPTHMDEYSQADLDHSNLKYDIQYYVDASGNLVETHDLYGTNVLVPGCTNFRITTLKATAPTMIQVTITAADGGNTVTRTCNITARNF
jgi:prepilin-type N-terminal cleavage/methylation domain-containing protein